jgi:hypothetical protein
MRVERQFSAIAVALVNERADAFLHHIAMRYALFYATLSSVTISLRNLPPKVEKALLKRAARSTATAVATASAE